MIIGLIAASPFLFVFVVESGNQEQRKIEEREPSEGLHEGDLLFDSTIWKRGFTDNFGIIYSLDAIRLRMVDDLLRRYRLRGMTREEVVSLLGAPPEPTYFNEYDFVYWLGPERWLAIKFGRDGRVGKTALVRF